MKKEDLRLRNWYGEGCYSGASSCEVLVYDINDKELLDNEFKCFNDKERFLGELDGKHSQVYGDICDEDDDNLESIIQSLNEADVNVFTEEYWQDDGSEVYKALKKAHDFVNEFQLKDVCIHKVTGEVLDISLYQIIKIAFNTKEETND